MRNFKVRTKIILPTGLLVLVLLAVTLVVTITQFNSINDSLVDERLEIAANGVRGVMDDKRRMVIEVGLQVSYDPRLAQAVLSGNSQEVLRVARQLVAEYGVTYITVAGADTVVLARTDEPDRHGDEFATVSLLEALEGIVSVAYTPVGVRQIPIRSSVPIIHQGDIIGIAVVGLALDTQKAVDALAERFNAEFTIFTEDTSGNFVRTASTLIDPQGNSVVGTQLADPEVISLLRQQREALVPAELFGNPYSAFYFPLFDPNGNMLGTIFMGLPLGEINAQRNFATILAAAMGIAGLAVALIVLYFISGNLVKPIKRLAGLVSDVSQGKLNVNIDKSNLSNDEIGGLTQDVYNLAGIIKSMVDDLLNVHNEYIKLGHIHYNIDDNKYQNSFKEMTGLVNNLLSSVTADILDVADALEHISDGDFGKMMNAEVWVGDWVVMPNAVNKLTDNLKSVNAEVNAMIDAAANKGDLNFKTDVDKYEGNWREIMDGLNHIAEAVYKPIKVVEIALTEMKAGNFDLDDVDKKIAATGINPSPSSYNGAFRDMIQTFDDTFTSNAAYIAEIAEKLKAVSRGDLTTKIAREYNGDFNTIKESLNDISETLHKTMSEISSASEHVLSGAKQIAISAQELANGAQEQASSVEELNATIDIINQQTQQNADNASTANDLSNKSTTNAQDGNEAMKQMLEAMTQIKDSSNDISKIVKTIQDIAFQTNLLALNASVEAARAGEHGKGFAVVADEVRTLAGRSQAAATETTELIKDSINRVESGSNIAGATAESLNAIVASADEVLAIISNISAASKDQAEAIAQISDGLAQISEVTQTNSAVSEQTAAASEELNSQAEVLQKLVEFFRL